MAQALYTSYKEDLMDSSAPNLAGGSMDVIFANSSYTFSAAHEDFADLGGNVFGDGGTARSNAENLQSPSVTGGTMDATDPVFTSTTGSGIAFILFYDDGVADASSTLVAYFDSIGSFTASANEVTIVLDASGVFYF